MLSISLRVRSLSTALRPAAPHVVRHVMPNMIRHAAHHLMSGVMSRAWSRAMSRATRGTIAVTTGCFAVLSACSGGDGPVEPTAPVPASITVSVPAVTFTTLEATSAATAFVRDNKGVAIEGASYTWTTDAPNVATVTGTGATATITARGRGVAILTVRSGTVSSSVTVLVRAAFAVTVNPTTGAIRVGRTTGIAASVSADEGASTAVTWKSSTPTVASVSGAGVVTGITPGTATIVARSVSDPTLSASAVISVMPDRGVIMTPPEMSVGQRESRTLTAQAFVDQGEATGIIWRSNHPLLASVTQQGVVTGITDGNAVIVALSAADSTLRAEAIVHVLPVIRSIIVSPAGKQLIIGQNQTFTAAVVVDQGASNAIAWSSSDPAVVTVNAQGVATAVGIGSATVRARSTSDSTRESLAQVTVTTRPIDMVLSTHTVGLTSAGSTSIAASVSADPGVPTGFTWTTRNASVATINAQGVVNAVGNGTTFLIATPNADATRSDSVRVTVAPRLAATWSAARLGGPLIEDIVSLWASSESLAYAVNSLGDLYRWNGAEWALSARGADFNTSFKAVHGVSPSAITAVGTNGVIVRYNGSVWTAQSSGITATLQDVWMHSANDAWAAGAGGNAVRLINGGWTASFVGSNANLRGVWGTANFAFAVGEGGTIRKWEAGSWTAVPSGTTEVLHDVLGAQNGTVTAFAVGELGTVVRWTGAGFEPEGSGTSSALRSITGNPQGELYATGESVALLRSSGLWIDVAPPYRTRFLSATLDAGGGLWVGGQRGLVMRRQSTNAWTTLSLTPDLLDVWSTSASHSIAVGELGFIYRYNGTTWIRQTAPTLERLNTVWAASSSVAFAGGDNGQLIRWNGSAWALQSSPTNEHIYAMWGASANDVWAVTDGGEVLHWDGSNWDVAYTQGEALYGVYGTSANDVHAVGSSGTALHWNGSAWTPRNAGVNHVLVGLWAADSMQSLSVGARDFATGVAMRYNGTWTEAPSGTTRILSAVWGVVGADLYAVGDAGTVVRYNGSTWQTMPSGSNDFLWAITGAPDASGGAFAVGLNGAMIQGFATGSSAMQSVTSASVRRAPQDLAPARGARRVSRGALPDGAARRKHLLQRR